MSGKLSVAALLALALALAALWPAPRPRDESPVAAAPALREPGEKFIAATPPASSLETALAATDAEADPDLRADALDRAVQAVGDATVVSTLDLLARDDSPAAIELCR